MAKILLIEDELEVREMLNDELTAEGYEVFESVNGAEGLEKMKEVNPDLVLCDRAMAVMSGYKLLEHLRENCPEYDNLPFIFITALSDPRDKAAVDHLNPSAYIDKPIDFSKLLEKMKELLPD